jgi:hypothetical protein
MSTVYSCCLLLQYLTAISDCSYLSISDIFLSHPAGMGGAAGNRAAAAAEGSGGAQIEHTFGRPMVLAKLGQYIMDIKVRKSTLLYPCCVRSMMCCGLFVHFAWQFMLRECDQRSSRTFRRGLTCPAALYSH